jgi:hypothetical protein
MSVQTTLNAVGVAQVIVTLKNVPPGNGAALAAAGRDVQHVTRHFRRSEDSRPGAVAAATGRRKPPSPCKVYKNLGVILGTEQSHVALHLWLQAIYLMASSKKGISSNQIHRTLGVTLKTAWFMSHRIREAKRLTYQTID